MVWGCDSQHNVMLGSHFIRFLGLHPNQLQKQCWDSHSWWRANPVLTTMPLLSVCCCFCSDFSTSLSLANTSPQRCETSSAQLLALRRGFSSPVVLRAWWSPAKTAAFCCHERAVLRQREERSCCICQVYFSLSFTYRWVSVHRWSLPPWLSHPQRCLQDLPTCSSWSYGCDPMGSWMPSTEAA